MASLVTETTSAVAQLCLPAAGEAMCFKAATVIIAGSSVFVALCILVVVCLVLLHDIRRVRIDPYEASDGIPGFDREQCQQYQSDIARFRAGGVL